MIDKNIVNPLYYLTSRCNLNCDYCCNKKQRESMNYEPTKDDIDSLFYNLTQNYKIKKFFIYGGEPTITDNLFYVMEKLTTLQCEEIRIFTNACNITRIKDLKEYFDTKNILIYQTLHPKNYSEEYINNILYIKENYNSQLAVILDKRYKNNIYKFLPIWKEHFYKDTLFQVVRLQAKKWSSTLSLETNEFSDIKFLQEFCKVYNMNIKDLFSFKYVKEEFKNKLCCNNFLRIGSDGFLTQYQGSCFSYNSDTRNLYDRYDDFKIDFEVVKCNNIIQPYRLCDVCTHE